MNRQCPPAASGPAFAWNGGLAIHTNAMTLRKMMPSRWKISLKPIYAAWLEIMRSSIAAPRCRSPLPSANAVCIVSGS